VDVLQQLVDARPDFLDVHDREHALGSCIFRRLCRGWCVLAVDNQDTARRDVLARDRLRVERQRRMTIPEHRPVPRRRVDEDDRELVRRAGDRARSFERNTFLEKTLSGELAKDVVAKTSEIASPPAETRAYRGGRRHLSSRKFWR